MTESFNKIIEKAKIIVEALPYISAYCGKTIVIKYGGNAMNNPDIIKTILQDIAALKIVGANPILVHGGGPEINIMLDRLAIKSRFENGLRVTDKDTMEVVQMVLGGKINKNIVSSLNTMNVSALGLCGKDGNLIRVTKMPPHNGVDYGYVGNIQSINVPLLQKLIADGFIPVIATIGVDENGESYNINADTVAGAIGGAIGAERLMYLTDIDGIRRNPDDPDSLIQEIHVDEVKRLIKSGAISGGMIPKVNSCIEAIEMGMKRVTVFNGTIPHSILLEIFTDQGIGTMVLR